MLLGFLFSARCEDILVERSIQKVCKKCPRLISCRWASTKCLFGLSNEFFLTPCLFIFGVQTTNPSCECKYAKHAQLLYLAHIQLFMRFRFCYAVSFSPFYPPKAGADGRYREAFIAQQRVDSGSKGCFLLDKLIAFIWYGVFSCPIISHLHPPSLLFFSILKVFKCHFQGVIW